MSSQTQNSSFYDILPLKEFYSYGSEEKINFLKNFVFESNKIENIYESFPENISPEKCTHPELSNHYAASLYVVNSYKSNISAAKIKKIHKTLMTSLINNAGKYRKVNVCIGNNGCPVPKEISGLMKNLEYKLELLHTENPKNTINSDKIWELHNEFEFIHPFIDGNGRTGRLLLNWLSLHYLKEFWTVKNDLKKNYYDNISDFRVKFLEENPELKLKLSDPEDIKQKRRLNLFKQMQKYDEKFKW